MSINDSGSLFIAVNEKSKLTVSVAQTTGKRWCSYHQGHTSASGGGFVARKGKRWMCESCMKLRNIRPLVQ